MRRDLVIVRCGKASLHPSWVAGGAPRAFDLFLCPYEDVDPACDRPDLARVIPGQKCAGLHAFLTAVPDWRAYGWIWLPDDDIGTTAAEIERFFDACRRHDAALAQPALTQDSQFSHVLTLRNESFHARTTTFVEMMAPCFRRDVLERLLPTFVAGPAAYGWGVDDAWGRLLGYRGIFVIDDVAVRHDRPVGANRTARAYREAAREAKLVRRQYDARRARKTLGGFAADGAFLPADAPGFLDAYLAGYRWILEREPKARARLLRDQADDPIGWALGRDRHAGSWWRRILARARG